MTGPVQALKLALQPPPPYKSKPRTESRQNQAGKQETQENRNRKQPTIQMVRKLSLRLQALGFKIPLSAVRRTWMRRISCGFWRGRCAKITGRFFDNGALRTTRAGLVSASGRAQCASAEKMPVGFCAAKIHKKTSSQLSPHLPHPRTTPTPQTKVTDHKPAEPSRKTGNTGKQEPEAANRPQDMIRLSAVRRTWTRRISCGFWRGCRAKITGRFSDDGAWRTTRAGLMSASGRAQCASAEKMSVGFCAAKIHKKSSYQLPPHPLPPTA
ncbi:MAG: hypothetical protein BWX68_03049 [Verrucomicrobia bacterium ADurb.Bin063]|nr:MAG: hypothetical protein BWX68_03049 [Verrucomicrobia bacterium ADurb.Bin063]